MARVHSCAQGAPGGLAPGLRRTRAAGGNGGRWAPTSTADPVDPANVAGTDAVTEVNATAAGATTGPFVVTNAASTSPTPPSPSPTPSSTLPPPSSTPPPHLHRQRRRHQGLVLRQQQVPLQDVVAPPPIENFGPHCTSWGRSSSLLTKACTPGTAWVGEPSATAQEANHGVAQTGWINTGRSRAENLTKVPAVSCGESVVASPATGVITPPTTSRHSCVTTR